MDTAEGLAARADEGDLTEILGNLMDNACKWARSHVRVQARAEGVGHGLLITVQDDGPGIPEDARERILERGVRADEHMPGQGLGLSMVHELVVEQYGGSVDVDAAPGGGARVTVRLDVVIV